MKQLPTPFIPRPGMVLPHSVHAWLSLSCTPDLQTGLPGPLPDGVPPSDCLLVLFCFPVSPIVRSPATRGQVPQNWAALCLVYTRARSLKPGCSQSMFEGRVKEPLRPLRTCCPLQVTDLPGAPGLLAGTSEGQSHEPHKFLCLYGNNPMRPRAPCTVPVRDTLQAFAVATSKAAEQELLTVGPQRREP